jgi:hypothetical protein
MFVEYFRVQGFKSLADVELTDIAAINVFHGPNDAGKSNILQALDLFFQVLPLAISIEDEVGTIGLLDRDLDPYLPEHTFRRQSPPRREIVWTARLRLADEEPPFEVKVRLQEERELSIEWPKEELADEIKHRLAEPGAGFCLIPAVRRFQAETLAEIRAEEEPPSASRARRPPTTAENLKRVLFNAFAGEDLDQRERFYRLRDLLEAHFAIGRLDVAQSSRLRELDRLHSQEPLRYGREIIARFLRPEGSIYLEDVGSGAQQALLILGQILFNPARLIGIEEPEMNLSPEWQERLMAVLRDLVVPGLGGLGQLFITSHSPTFEFQDRFYKVTYTEGATRVERLPLQEREFIFGPRQPLGEQRGQRLNSQNQITLYREAIEDLGLKYGDMVYFSKNAAGRWELQPEAEALAELQEAFDDLDSG